MGLMTKRFRMNGAGGGCSGSGRVVAENRIRQPTGRE